MPNLLAEMTEAITAGEWIVAGAGIVIAGCIATAAGVFRTSSIERRHLPAPIASPLNVWLTILVALAGNLFLSGFVLRALMGPLTAPFSPHQTAVIYPVSSLCGLFALLLAHWIQAPRWHMSSPLRDAIKPALLGAAATIPLIFSATLLTQQALHWLRLPAQESHALLVAFGETSSRLDRWLVVISAVVIAPLFEEMLFRAQLQTALAQLTKSPWAAVLIASTLFGLAHGSAWMFFSLFLLAIALGYIYERTANLYATIFIHALFNATMIALAWHSLSHP